MSFFKIPIFTMRKFPSAALEIETYVCKLVFLKKKQDNAVMGQINSTSAEAGSEN